MKKILSLSAFILFALSGYAQTPFSLTTLTYSQDFNSLDTNYNIASSNLPGGWAIYEIGTTATVDQMYKPYPPATANTGDTYSFGSVGSTERALGSLRSAGNRMRYGVGFTNNTGSPITSLNISFKGEQWRSGDTATIADSLYLEYSTTASGISDTLSSWTANWSTMFNSVVTNQASTILDGNTNFSNITGNFLVSIPVGSTIYLRWVDPNLVGSDDGLAIDDLNITFGTAAINQPLIVSTIPPDNATGVTPGTTSLSITFDKNITIGTGNVKVKNLTDNTDQTIPVVSTSVSGMTATIPNVTLLSAKEYAVQFDSTCYKNGIYNGYGIYDNTTWNFSTLNPKPLISSLNPFDNSNNVALNSVASVTFDKNIALGTGSVKLINNTDNVLAQTITLPSASVTVSGAIASISGLTLLAGKSYAIQYDSTCFNAAGNNSLGIYDTTTWNFTTVPPPPPPVTSLNETFTNCAAPNYGLFTQTSISGTQTWGCTTFGNGDANAVRINGGNATSSNDNEDWLISPPLNIVAMTDPHLQFYAKRRFSGSTSKQVFVSSNFTGDVSTATWTNLNQTGLATLDTVWTKFKNISMTSYKSNIFHVAFKYTSTAGTPSVADEWSLDDIRISEGPESISAINMSSNDFYVIGTATNNQVNFILNAQENDEYNYVITDYTGKVIAKNSFNAFAGRNKISIPMAEQASGLYFLQINNSKNRGSAKFVK